MEGYAKMASLMGRHPEMTIRLFGALNAQNILYLQAELTLLEKKLHELSLENEASLQPDRRIYSNDWDTLSRSATSNDGDERQWKTMLDIRKVLKQYSKFNLQNSAFALKES